MPNDTVSLGDRHLPDVIKTLAALLPEFEGEALEAQLETFDTFLNILDESLRPEIASLLEDAAANMRSDVGRARVAHAAWWVRGGGRAAGISDLTIPLVGYPIHDRGSAQTPEIPTGGAAVNEDLYWTEIRSSSAECDFHTHDVGDLGLAERWVRPDGQVVAWKVLFYFKGEEDLQHYVWRLPEPER